MTTLLRSSVSVRRLLKSFESTNRKLFTCLSVLSTKDGSSAEMTNNKTKETRKKDMPRPILHHPNLLSNDLNRDAKLSMINISRTETENKSLPEIIHIPKKGRSNSTSSSVSTILNVTMPLESRMMLLKWKERMVAELGDMGFQIYQTGMKKMSQ